MKTLKKRALQTLTIAFLACVFFMAGKTKAFAFDRDDISDSTSLAKVTGVSIDASSSSLYVSWNSINDESIGYFVSVAYYDSSDKLLGSRDSYTSYSDSTGMYFSKTAYSGATKWSASVRCFKYVNAAHYISSVPSYATSGHVFTGNKTASIPKLTEYYRPRLDTDEVYFSINYPSFTAVPSSTATSYRVFTVVKDLTCNEWLENYTTSYSGFYYNLAGLENHKYTAYLYNAVWNDEYATWMKSAALTYNLVVPSIDEKFSQSISYTPSSVTVKWTTPSVKYDGFIVYRAGMYEEGIEKVATLGKTVRSYTDKSSLSLYTPYVYLVFPYTKAFGGSNTKYSACPANKYFDETPSYDSEDIFAKGCVVLKLPAVTLKSVTQSAAGRKITWKAGTYNGYVVYCKKKGDSKWTALKNITNPKTTTYTDARSFAKGAELTYLVKGYISEFYFDDVKMYSPASKTITVKNTIYTPTAPVISSIANTATGAKLTWKASKNCIGYYVYRKTGSGKYAKIATVKGAKTLTYTDKTAVNGTTYTYLVYAYSCNAKKASAAKSALRLTMSSISAASTAKHQATVSWTANTAATGYEIYISSGDYSTVKTINDGATASAVVSNLMSTEKYTIKVRAYKLVSGKKVYSSYSTAVSVIAL